MTWKIWNPWTSKRPSCSQLSIDPEQEHTLPWWCCRLLRWRSGVQPRLARDSQAQGPSPAVQWLCPLQESLLLWTKQVKLTQPSTSSPLFPDFKQQRFVSLKYLHVKRTDLYIRTRVDLVDGVTRCSASFTVQVVTLHEDGVVTEAPDPHVPFTFTLQLHSFAYVQPQEERQSHIHLVTASLSSGHSQNKDCKTTPQRQPLLTTLTQYLLYNSSRTKFI